jgi:hypothetical protein
LPFKIERGLLIMNSKYYFLLALSCVVLLSSCLKKNSDRYECKIHDRATLDITLNQNMVLKADDYVSGAVYCSSNTGKLQTIVDMGMLHNGEAVSVLFKIDGLVSKDNVYTSIHAKESFLGLGNKKYALVLETLQFNVFEDDKADSLSYFEYINLASGKFSGKFLKDGDTDSTLIEGTFCFDEAPIPTK